MVPLDLGLGAEKLSSKSPVKAARRRCPERARPVVRVRGGDEALMRTSSTDPCWKRPEFINSCGIDQVTYLLRKRFVRYRISTEPRSRIETYIPTLQGHKALPPTPRARGAPHPGRRPEGLPAGGAVHPLSGHGQAPAPGRRPPVREAGELPALEEPLPHVGHSTLHPRLVPGMAHPRRVLR